MVGRKDPAKLEAELNTLRRKLENLQDRRMEPDPPVETVQNIILGNPNLILNYFRIYLIFEFYSNLCIFSPLAI